MELDIPKRRVNLSIKQADPNWEVKEEEKISLKLTHHNQMINLQKDKPLKALMNPLKIYCRNLKKEELEVINN